MFTHFCVQLIAVMHELGARRPTVFIIQFMRPLSIFLLFTISSLGFKVSGQTITISGKIIAEDLTPIPQVGIQNSDKFLLGTTDLNGRFKIEIPANTKSLFFSSIGFEWTSINLTDSCNQLDIILLYNVIYDFKTLKKVDKLRKKRFDKLPILHLEGYQKGIFSTEKSCYIQNFIQINRPNKT
jgi:hypothetical protein